jgi:SEC-C motif
MELLGNAAASFDAGSLAEAQNLATRIRVLVHDGPGPGSSFLAQIGAKECLPYLDTAQAEDPPGVIGFGGGLCMISAFVGDEGSSRYKAPLDRLAPERLHPPASFVDWWGDEILADDSDNSFSRRAFVLAVANQDGGSHFDDTLDAAYAELTRDRSLTSFQPAPGGDESFKNIAPPTIRQIAYELNETLVNQVIKDSTAPFGLRVREPICSLSIHTRVEAGRNDPCPCGSGRKTKRCFALREPRRRRTIDELLGEAT